MNLPRNGASNHIRYNVIPVTPNLEGHDPIGTYTPTTSGDSVEISQARQSASRSEGRATTRRRSVPGSSRSPTWLGWGLGLGLGLGLGFGLGLGLGLGLGFRVRV